MSLLSVFVYVFQIECSNGQVGFGRKRRAIEMSSTDKNKLFEVTMSTFIKVDDMIADDVTIDQGKFLHRAKWMRRSSNCRVFITFMTSVTLFCIALLVLSEFIRKGKNRTHTKERAVIAEEVREQSGPTTIRTHERAFLTEEIKFKYKVTDMVLNRSSCNTLSLNLVLLLFCFYKLL